MHEGCLGLVRGFLLAHMLMEVKRHWGKTRLGQRRSGDGDNGGGRFLKARVSRQELGSKEKEDKRSLNRFLVIKTAHKAR